MTSSELKDLVKSHFNLVEAEVNEELTNVTEEFDARTDAEEEGYKDGLEDAIEDVKEAIADVAKKDMAEEDEVEMEETEKEEMEEEEEQMKVEDIVEAIVKEVKDEMAKLEDKMAALEDKVEKMEEAPAAEPTITSTGKKMGAEATKRGFAAFDPSKAKNADRIKMAIEQLKNRKK